MSREAFHTEDDFGAVFDRQMADASNELQNEKLQRYIHEIKKFTHPPYIWEMPEEIVTPDKANYNLYMFRPNVNMHFFGQLELLLREKPADLYIPPEVRQKLEKIMELRYSFQEKRERRTQEEVDKLWTGIHDAIHILRDLSEKKLLAISTTHKAA